MTGFSGRGLLRQALVGVACCDRLQWAWPAMTGFSGRVLLCQALVGVAYLCRGRLLVALFS